MSELLKVNEFNIDTIFFSYLIQSGADNFEILQTEEKIHPSSKYLESKLSLANEHEFWNIRGEIHEIFNRIMPKEFRSKEEIWSQYYAPLHSFIRLFSSILIAKKRGGHVVTDVKLEMEELELILPFELFHSINNFVMCLDSVDSTPATKTMIENKDIEVFSEILKSDLFKEYSSGHLELSNPEQNIEISKSKINEKGKQLIKKYKDEISPSDLAFSVMKIGGKVANVLVGGVIGTLIEFFTEKLSIDSDKDERLIVYDFHQLQNTTQYAILEKSGNPLLSPKNLKEASDKFLDKNWRKKIRRPS